MSPEQSASLGDPLAFCPPLQKMLAEGQSETGTGESRAVHGASTINNLIALRQIMLQIKPTRTLEIGLAHGASAMTILQTHHDLNHQSHWSHLAIDPFQTQVWIDCGITSAKKVIDDEQHFSCVQEFSKTALPKLLENAGTFELIYIDGSHLFEDVFLDVFYCCELLKKDGVMLLDDCMDPHVNKVVRFYRQNYRDILTSFALPAIKKTRLKQWANRLGFAQLKAFQKIGDPPRHHRAKFHNF